MLDVNRGVEQIEGDSINLEFNNRRLRLLNLKDIRNICLQRDEVAEVVQEVFFWDELGEHADGVDVCSGEVDAKAVGAEDKHFRFFGF